MLVEYVAFTRRTEERPPAPLAYVRDPPPSSPKRGSISTFSNLISITSQMIASAAWLKSIRTSFQHC